MASKKRLGLLLLMLAATLGAAAEPVLRNLEINVVLHNNGDADIEERRQMEIDDEGTECYTVIGNLNGSDIKNFSVSDDTGTRYVNEGSWNVNRSRQQKTGRCGMVKKSDGYELCWGLGKSGFRYYTVKYTVTHMVRSYKESDGFNWMFVTDEMKPAPQSAKVSIFAKTEDGLPEDSVKAWAFGFKGDVSFEDDGVVVRTTEPMTSEMSMIVMVEIPKGLLHPSMKGEGSFKEVRKKAFEGSDYKEQTWLRKAWNAVTADLDMLLGILFCVFIAVAAIWYGVRTRRERKKLLETVDWYREIPVNGNLVRARSLHNAFYVSGGIKTEDLVGAMIMRLIRTNTLRIEQQFLEPSGLKKMMGGKGSLQECITIADFNDQNRLINTPEIRKLYDIFYQAAGEDHILQPKELKRWMQSHETEVMDLMRSIEKSCSIKEAKRTIDDTRKVFGLKMFLSDFTLANERHLSEVSLWNDYLVYATLFGIADQVKKDMKQLNPEYLEMNQITRNLTNNTLVPVLMATTYNSAHAVQSKVDSRSSGGGGRSSFGGGGGFSGGGHGGGVR